MKPGEGLLLTTILLALSRLTHSATVTIASNAGYVDLRACAQSCVWGAGDDLIDIGLECGPPWENECYCRTDLAAVASSFLTS